MKARIVAKLEPKRQDVDKETYDAFHRRLIAPAYRGADDDIRLAADPRQAKR